MTRVITKNPEINHGTNFKNNIAVPIHNWYSYLEGFAWNFVKKTLTELPKKDDFTVLDPFCGSGTTLVESGFMGLKSIGYDINPFLTFVSKIKTDLQFDLRATESEMSKLQHNLKEFQIKKNSWSEDLKLSELYANDRVFSPKVLPKVLFVKRLLNNIPNQQIHDFFVLAFCSILIEISNYRRGPDLAYKRIKHDDYPVLQRFLEKIQRMVDDLKSIDISRLKKPEIFNEDSRYLKKTPDNAVDCVITSPPYLNGTNYFRNTKLELWFTGMLTNADELHQFREKTITAGINDVFKSKNKESSISEVKTIVTEINKTAYDQRIPQMISTYFEEISECFTTLYRTMRDNGRCYWVIGDSAFSKILIPTDRITVSIAENAGFKHIKTEITRQRKSRSGLGLHEAVVILEKK